MPAPSTVLYPSVPYTNLTAIQNRLSANGVALRIDDVPPDTLGDVIGEASSIIDEYAATIYTQASLQTSNLIYYKATDIAMYLLCERRGNPAPMSVGARYERAMEFLAKVQVGQVRVWDAVERKVSAPTMSNLRVILRPYNRSVVESGVLRSTGTVTQYTQNRDPWDVIGGNQTALLLWTF